MDGPKLRRVVTGHTSSGRSTLLTDGDVKMISAPGSIVGPVWSTDRSPASNEGDADPTGGPLSLQPAPGGTQFWIVTIPPRPGGAASSGDLTAAMHATATIDYVIMISGEITLLLEEGETTLRASDILVQRGSAHSWENRGGEPAVMAVVLVDAAPLAGAAASH